MATITRFEDLEIWQLARQLCIECEKLVKEGLGNKNARLKDQLQASTGSVMDNIAEGFEKENTKEFIHYLYHSKGSCGEARSQLIRILDFEYFESERVKGLIARAQTISIKIKQFVGYLKTVEYKGQRHASEPEQTYGEPREIDFFDLIEAFQNSNNQSIEYSNSQIFK